MSHSGTVFSVLARRNWPARLRLLLFALVLAVGSSPGRLPAPAGAGSASPPSIGPTAAAETSAILPSEMRDGAATDRRMLRGQAEQAPGSAGSAAAAAGVPALALLTWVLLAPPPRRRARLRPLPPDLPPGPGSPARLPFPTGPPAAAA